ncbi:hypothetical protein V3N99_05595 [Dermatophilaceae bacterium Soc4.6]
MANAYAGRHRTPGRHRAPLISARHRLPAKVVRRPLLTAGAMMALVGASAAGYAKAGDVANSAQILSLPAAAIGQATAANNAQLEEDANLRASASSAALNASVIAQQRNADAAAAAQKAKAAAVASAARLAAERRAQADRAARAAQRQAIVANAQKDPKSVARLMLADYGWSTSQWSCLEQLWIGESGWNFRASNSSSGAYGIPQSLPASKMASVGADYRTNPVTQITWGMQYVKSSYGTPCNALSQWQSRSPHWY